jgi:DUF3102 family protein/DNA methylase
MKRARGESNTTIYTQHSKGGEANNIADEINRLHRGIISSLRTSVVEAIRIGELLTQERDKLKHGEWLPWLKENVEFSHMTAYRYIECYENRSYFKNKINTVLTFRDIPRLLSGIKKQKQRERRAAAAAEFEEAEDNPDCQVFEGDVKTVQFEPQSLDAIITDPPYPREYLPLWNDLGLFAQQHLKVGGVLVTMAPQSYLPEILSALCEMLTYQWIIACNYGGNFPLGSAIQRKVAKIRWKPLLVFRNGGEPVDIPHDRYDYKEPDKEHHDWGQGIDCIQWQIETFTKVEELVCDPFLGGGTTGVAAVQLKRRFVGFDLDAEAVKATRGRLQAT